MDRHDAYRKGICTDCRKAPHSAGRPRCNTCHDKYTERMSRGEI